MSLGFEAPQALVDGGRVNIASLDLFKEGLKCTMCIEAKNCTYTVCTHIVSLD